MGTLYRLTSPSGKSYIGISSKTTAARWGKHVEHALGKRDSGALYAALRKYGHEAFVVETLVVADDWAYLCELEKQAIRVFSTKTPNGYNITDGGEGVVGREITEESRARISAAQKLRYQRPGEKERLYEAGIKGAITLKARREALRVDGKAPWQMKARTSKHPVTATFTSKLNHSLATRQAMADPVLRKQLSDSAKNRLARPEEYLRLCAINKGRKQNRTPEQQAVLTAGIKAAWADPEKKAARLAKIRATKAAKQQAKGAAL